MKSMIISISGPQSTGKTTLHETLRRVLPPLFSNVRFVFEEEDARVVWNSLRENYNNLNEYINVYGFGRWQYLVYRQSIRTLLHARTLVKRSKDTIVILDRSVIDCIVYAQMYSDEIEKNLYEEMIDNCIKYSQLINHFFFTTPNSEYLVEDELREFFKDVYKKEVVLFSLFHEIGDVLPLDLVDRVQKVATFVQQKLGIQNSFSIDTLIPQLHYS